MSTDAPSIVDAPLQVVAARLQDAHRSSVETVRVPITALRNTVAQACDDHAAARSVLDDVPLDDPDALRAAVHTYRDTTVRTVLTPLLDALDTLALGAAFQDAREPLSDVRKTLSDDLPETLIRPEPEDLFAPKTDDGTGTRMRKGGKHALRRLQAMVGAEAPQQTIPIQALVVDCAEKPMAAAHDRALHDTHQTVAQWVARTEHTLSAWTHAVLTAEHLLTDAAADTNTPPDTSSDNASSSDTASDKEPPGTDGEASSETNASSEKPAPAATDAPLKPVRAQMEALHEVLNDGAALTLEAVQLVVEAATETALAHLREAAERSGAPDAPTWTAPKRAIRRTRAARADRAAAWPDWFDQSADRLRFLHTLCNLRDTLLSTQRNLETDVQATGPDVLHTLLREGRNALRELHMAIDDALQVPTPGQEAALLREFDALRTRARRTLDRCLFDPLDALHIRRDVREAVTHHADGLRETLQTHPSTFTVHDLPDSEAPIRPNPSVHDVQWSDITDDALRAFLLDAWMQHTSPLVRAIHDATAATSDVRTIVQFNLGAALEELQDAVVAQRRGDPSEPHVHDARELALDGLARCIQTLEETDATLTDETTPFVRATRTATAQAWTHVHDRARAAGGARAQMLRAQSWAVRNARSLWEATSVRLRILSLWGQRTARTTTRLANAILRKGRSAVEQSVDEEQVRETIEALSTVESRLDALPLVYRRLFSFRPVMDPTLLMGREQDLARVERHIEHWRGGLNNALVITGPAGSGRTSLLNVLRATHLRDAERFTIDLDERIHTEAHLAQVVADALALPFDAPPETLTDVADTILSAWTADTFRVGLVETLEHVFLRCIGGGDLTARFLQFLSSTDSRLLWIVTCSTAGWQAIAANIPDAVPLVDHHPFDPLDRTELEDLVMRRHRRSGLSITFDSPNDVAAPLLARRVRATSDADERQALLRDAYFSRLYDLCGQNVMLALFYWFRSLRFDDDSADERLHVAPLQPIQFDMLDRFSLTQSFALKSLLDHATLTVEELATVTQMSKANSHAVLESLGNALLITTVDGLHSPGAFRFTAIAPGVRYRIRPLVVHPVTRHLRSRNIVHG